MPQVVVIGSGVIGASVAWHLTELGWRDVVVADRAPALGGGSTAAATGGFRSQFATEVNVRLSLLSREKLRRFKEEIGVDGGYRAYGYLFLARSDASLAVLAAAQRVQRACGVAEARMVDAATARSINPAIGDDAVIGGAFCPTDGFIRPMEILRGYYEAASRRGVRFEFGVQVTGIRAEGDRVVALQTSQGSEVTGEHFVNAAGAWAGTFGFEVPVAPLRRRVAPTVATHALPAKMPMTIWVDDGYHLRVRDERVLLLWPDPAPAGFDTSIDDEWVARVRAFTDARVPALRGVPIDRPLCWAGLYEMSPDRHAIVGRAPRYTNAWLANGSSGHGVMHSPALGQIVAELISERPTSVDVRALRPERFAEGAAIESPTLL